MNDDFDSVAFSRLSRLIYAKLHGDGQKDGLHRAVLTSQSWEDFIRTKASILAYEDVVEMMHKVARDMNEPHRREEPSIARRA